METQPILLVKVWYGMTIVFFAMSVQVPIFAAVWLVLGYRACKLLATVQELERDDDSQG